MDILDDEILTIIDVIRNCIEKYDRHIRNNISKFNMCHIYKDKLVFAKVKRYNIYLSFDDRISKIIISNRATTIRYYDAHQLPEMINIMVSYELINFLKLILTESTSEIEICNINKAIEIFEILSQRKAILKQQKLHIYNFIEDIEQIMNETTINNHDFLISMHNDIFTIINKFTITSNNNCVKSAIESHDHPE